MPRGRKPKAETKEETKEETPKVATSVSSFNAVEISNEYGEYVRTYSKKEHGPRFAELADCFLRDRPNYKKDVKLG